MAESPLTSVTAPTHGLSCGSGRPRCQHALPRQPTRAWIGAVFELLLSELGDGRDNLPRHTPGDLQVNLALSVPSAANRRLATIPEYLSPDHIQPVLGTRNLQTVTSLRDYATLLLLARLGLRAGE